jgi:hypothetical protein
MNSTSIVGDNIVNKSTKTTRRPARAPAAFTVGSTWGHRARAGAMAVEVVAIDGPRLVYRDLRTGHVDSYVLARACQPSAFWPIPRPAAAAGAPVDIPAASATPDPVAPPPPPPPPPAPSSALVSRQVDGWTLFDGAGSTWVRDLDLAERAGLAVPRDIRRTIAKAIDDGALMPVGAAHSDGTPGFHVVEELVQGGKGSVSTVATYYLNQEGALFIITRLRAPKAIEATKAIVRVFAAVMRGEVVPAGLDRLAAIMERQMAASDARMDRLEGVMLRLVERPAAPVLPAPPPAPPPIPVGWLSSDHIAAIVADRLGLPVSKYRVDTAIRGTTIRDDGEQARQREAVTFDERGGRHANPQWFYAPTVVDRVHALLTPQDPPGDFHTVEGGKVATKGVRVNGQAATS